jgi:predicted permease
MGHAFGQDFRFAFRMLRKSPGFAAAAVLVLALGIGATAAMFSVINAGLLRPVVGTGVDARLMAVYSGQRSRPDAFRPFSYPEYLELRERNAVFTHLIAEAGVRTGLTEQGETRRISTRLVSSNYFTALQVPMAAGRAFTLEEEHPRADATVVVVSPAIARRYGGAERAVGRRLVLNGKEFTIVGVAPEWFRGTMAVMTSELWAPFGAARELVPADQLGYLAPVSFDRATPTLLLAGVLRPGVSPTAAESRLAPLADALAAAYPETSQDQRLLVRPRPRTARGAAPRSDSAAFAGALVLMTLAGMVLGVACLNLANLLLARGSARRAEIAVRLALGASRLRIVRQLVIEGVLLAAPASALAVALAWSVATAFVASLTRIAPMPIVLDVTPDARVIAVVIVAAVAATVLFSLGPAWRVSRPAFGEALKAGTARGARRTNRPTLSGALVAAQITMSVALLVTAGLFVRTSARAAESEPGFPLAGGLIAELDGALAGIDAREARGHYLRLLDRVRGIRGVRDASLASIVPFGDGAGRLVRGDGEASTAAPTFSTVNVVGKDYFSTIGLPIRSGRDFTAAEAAQQSGPVAIVDRTFAERVFGVANPLGRVVHLVDPEGGVDDSLQIVGLVPPVQDDILEPLRPHLYLPFGRSFRVAMTLHVRVDPGGEAGMIELVRRAVAAESRPLPLLSIRTLTEHRDRSATLWTMAMGARVFAAFGLIALVLATSGVYGLRAYLIALRTRDIGIRFALGASRRRIVAQLLAEGTGLAAVGLAAGLLVAAGIVRVLQSGLALEMSAFEPVTFVGAGTISALATGLALLLPARRALRIDPAVALRPE